MILTVTLNPCIDRTVYLDRLTVGSYNRVQSTRSDPAGKGLNVSIVLKNLNEDTLCTGFNFSENGRLLEQLLDERDVAHQFLMAEGAIRTNIKLFDNSCQVMTEVNEAGPFVPPEAVEQLLQKADSLLEHTDILVMSGSVPPGVPADIYQRLIRMAHKKQVKSILDASGEPFLLGLREKPYLIKPNTLEFEQAFHAPVSPRSIPMDTIRSILEGCISRICISIGEEGALFADRGHIYRARPLPLKPQGLTGAGDSMVAGICYAIRRRLGTDDMLRWAMASAGGSIRKPGTILAEEADIRELLPQVEIEQIR